MLAFYLDFLCLLIWCLFCGCWFEVWPVAVLRAAECMWGAPAWRTETGGYTQMDTQMLQQTVVRLQFIDFWTWKQQLQGFGAFSQCTVVMKPLYLNSWGQCLCSVKCDFVFSYEFPLWTEKFLTKIYKHFSFLRRNHREKLWRVVWISACRYISAEPVNRAPHVTGLLYSCHCTQQQMHCTHWLVSNAVRLTCGPQFKSLYGQRYITR